MGSLSEALVEGWWGSRRRGEALRFLAGLGAARLCGERFSLPDEASFDGDLAGRRSRSASNRDGRSLDLDRLAAPFWFCRSSLLGEERLSERPGFCSPRQPDGELDLWPLSLDLSAPSAPFLSLDLLLPRPLSFVPVSLAALVTLSCFVSLVGAALSADLLLLRRLAADLPPSVESRLDFPLFPPLGDMGLPELPF